MRALRNVSVLEHNVPGIVVSVRIPSSEILKIRAEQGVPEINCRNFFSKLLPKEKTIAAPSDIAGPVSDEKNGPVFSKPLVANRYDNIIDQLERKYYCGSVVQSTRDESSESDGSSSPTKEADHVGNSKSQKRTNFADDYDMDDPFIDDEEMIYEVEAEIKKNRTKTKHDGFFVSAGKLEVSMSPKRITKASSSGANKNTGLKPPAAVTAATAPPAANTMAESSATVPVAKDIRAADSAALPQDVKKRKRRTKAELEEAAALKAQRLNELASTDGKILSPSRLAVRATAPKLTSLSNVSGLLGAHTTAPAPQAGSSVVAKAVTAQPITTAGAAPVDSTFDLNATQDGPPGAPTRPKAEREAWQPNDKVLAAIETFRTHFASTGIKLAKSSNIPKSLEDALHDVDCAVLPHINATTLARTSGYYESLQSAMGGEVQTGKIRSLMVRLRLRDCATTTLRGIEDQIRQLMADLKAAVTPCPEKLQPSFKAAKKEKAQQAKAGDANEAASPEPAAVTEGVTEGKAGVGEGAGLVSVAAQCLVDLQTERGPATQSSGSNEDPAAAGGAGAGGSTGAATPTLTRYEYICNWTRPMKATLCQIEQGLKLWVVQENQYREKLTVHDKKNMDESDVRLCFSVSVISWFCKCFWPVCPRLLHVLNSTLCPRVCCRLRPSWRRT
jgi:hypothetical protein